MGSRYRGEEGTGTRGKGAHHADKATLGIGQATEHRLHGHLQVEESR